MSKIKTIETAAALAKDAAAPGGGLLGDINSLFSNFNKTVNGVKSLIELEREIRGSVKTAAPAPAPIASNPPAQLSAPPAASAPAKSNKLVEMALEKYGNLTVGEVLKQLDGVQIKTLYEVIKNVGLK